MSQKVSDKYVSSPPGGALLLREEGRWNTQRCVFEPKTNSGRNQMVYVCVCVCVSVCVCVARETALSHISYFIFIPTKTESFVAARQVLKK